MDKQPNALVLADVLDALSTHAGIAVAPAAAELRRQHELIAELVEALQGLDEAYCRAGSPLSRAERNEDRQRLIAARAALSKAKEQ